jgi:hypothetical protein
MVHLSVKISLHTFSMNSEYMIAAITRETCATAGEACDRVKFGCHNFAFYYDHHPYSNDHPSIASLRHT